MARIRSIKPEAFTSETLASRHVHARWTFAGLWCYVDDEGRGLANPGLIKAAVWPLDDDISVTQVGAFLDDLEAAYVICRYEVDGKRYLHVVNFGEHQHPNRPLPSKLPACSRRTHGGLSEQAVRTHPEGPGGAPGTPAASSEATTTETGIQGDIGAGQDPLTEDSVSGHGVVNPKPSGTPPTPLRYEQGEGDGGGDGVQQATPAAAKDSRQLTVTQRSKRLTDAYAEAEPMCKWPAVNTAVIRAIKTEKYADEEIRDALLRMAKDGTGVTIESLRVELAGFGKRGSGQQSATSQSTGADRARAAREAGQRVQAMLEGGNR